MSESTKSNGVPSHYWICADCLHTYEFETRCVGCGPGAKVGKWPNPTALAFPDFKAYWLDKGGGGDENALARDRWIDTFWAALRALRDGSTDRFVVGQFWIKLHGLLVEMPIAWNAQVEPFETLSAEAIAAIHARGPGPSTALKCIGHVMALRNAARRLSARLSREEHIYADWRRQSEAHPTQEAYDLRLRKKGAGLKDGCEIKSLGVTVPVAELSMAITRVERSYLGREPAPAFASKVELEAREIYMVQNEFAALGNLREWRTPEV